MTPDPIAHLYAALGGRPVLLPCRPGTKAPYGSAWQDITYDDTQTPDYQADLRTDVNIGVLLGAPSAHKSFGESYRLAVVNIDDLAAALEWEGLNPETACATLRTDTPRGRLYWLWVLDHTLPHSAEIHHAHPREKWGSLLADGTQAIIAGTHPDGPPYATDAAHRPARVDFADLKWPEGLDLPWRPSADDPAALAATYGDPYYLSSNGALQVNQSYWPAHYAARHRILYDPEEARFYRYNPDRGLWSDHTEALLAHEISGQMKEFADANRAAGSRLIVKRTSSLLSAIVSLLKGHAEKRAPFQPQLGRVHLKNGMLNLRSKELALAPFSPSHYSRNQIPIALDPTATCPRFKSELLSAALPEVDIELLQRVAGQCLLGVNLSQKIVMLTGLGGTGKSTLAKVISLVIGQENIAALRTEHLHQRFEIFNYVGKTLLLGADVPGNFLQTEGAYVLKSLVGGDALTAEPKHGKYSLTIEGNFNVLISSNSRLSVKLDGDASAYERRLILIPYTLPKPARAIPNFAEMLVAQEGPGIFLWMLEGARRVLDEWETHGTFRMDAIHRRRVDDLLAESDSIRYFTKTVIARTDESHTITKEDIQANYVTYCEARGWKPVSGNYLKQRLTDTILEIHRKTERNDIKRPDHEGAPRARRGYAGLRLLPYEDQ